MYEIPSFAKMSAGWNYAPALAKLSVGEINSNIMQALCNTHLMKNLSKHVFKNKELSKGFTRLQAWGLSPANHAFGLTSADSQKSASVTMTIVFVLQR